WATGIREELEAELSHLQILAAQLRLSVELQQWRQVGPVGRWMVVQPLPVGNGVEWQMSTLGRVTPPSAQRTHECIV
ncbi:hypothetical protein PENTCL1PPCAC_25887, partial [Pristionchus entomophagus]